MAASMWRMNGLWRGMAAALLLHSLLLNNRMMCHAHATDNPDSSGTAVPGTTEAVAPAHEDPTTASAAVGDDNMVTVSITGDTTATAYTGGDSLGFLVLTGTPTILNADAQEGAETSGTFGTPVVPVDLTDLETKGMEATDLPVVFRVVPETQVPLLQGTPHVKCVEKEAINENTAIKAIVTTNDCEQTKMIIQDNPAAWCTMEVCYLNVFQEENTMLVSSPNAQMSSVVEALQGELIKGPLGVSEVETPPSSSSSSSVFVAVLLTGLLVAAALIGGYCVKTRRGDDAKGTRLAEEAYPVDVENQGNTLVSVAPLNPPSETQEKPTVNGDSPDETKTPPPPTNGHSTAKTADTEL